MPGKIFVNYRRDDERAQAARLRDRLAGVFGAASVFMDVDSLMAGQRFDKELEKALAQTEVFLAVIGPRWMEHFEARQASGERDYVREEIAGALARGTLVIPVLIEGTSLPREDTLPDDIRPLVLHQKHDLTHESFGQDVDELVAIIRSSCKTLPESAITTPTSSTWAWLGATVAGVLIVVWAAVSYWGVTAPWRASLAVVGGQTDDEAKRVTDAEAKRRAGEKAEAVAATAIKNADDEARTKAQTDAQTVHKADETRQWRQAALRAEGERKRAEEETRRDPERAVAAGSGQSFRDRVANGQPCSMCPELLVVPSGSITLGSPSSEAERESWKSGTESPQVEVTIARPFAVGKFAVTRGEFAAFVEETGYGTYGGCHVFTRSGWQLDHAGSWRSPGIAQDDRHPVVCVDWDDAKAYVAWLSRKTGKTYRLLSETEREYVTRAGTSTPFVWGWTISPRQANYNGNLTYSGSAKGEYRQRTVPVDSFEANHWGLYNVHGNVWEWTEDCWNDSNSGNPGNGRARVRGDCSRRVVRGGSWGSDPAVLRAANRVGATAGHRHDTQGFRVARALDP